MNETAARILAELEAVKAHRARRGSDAALAASVQAVKGYQQRRFERSYADLMASPRYGAAARFFLEELYGPADFAERDAQFARVVPALVRLFPHELVETVEKLARLHALSERLDTAMGEQLRGHAAIDADAYAQAWRAVGDAPSREEQVTLALRLGAELDRLTRKPLLRQSLRLMRGPAHAAGLAALQGFLERGFDTFKAMKGAEDFLARIGTRERALAALLFAVVPDPARLLGELP